jgi:hypothetical protein
MINFLYPTEDFDYSIYNRTEETFTPSLQNSYWSFEWILNQVGIEYKNIISTDSPCYVKFNLNIPTEYTDLENIPEDIWKKIANELNVYLLLYQATEATPFYYWKYRWDRLKEFLISKNIPYNKIKYICGDIDAKENHIKHRDDYWSGIGVLGIDIFEIMHLERHRQQSGINYVRSISEYLKTENKKKFLNLNNRIRPNKQALIFYLKKYGYYENGLVSNLWDGTDQIIDRETFDRAYNFDESKYEDFKKLVPVRNEIDSDSNDNQSSPIELYTTTNFSLVSETYTGSAVRFITEKTYKPILMGHPFLIHGTTRTLEYLRESGYETFPEIFNESYDSRESSKEQLKEIIFNLDNDFCFNKSIKEKLIYNQNHFLKQTSKKKIAEKIIKFL